MAQFTVYRNNNPQTQNSIPYLLDIQSDLLQQLATRVVVPLYTGHSSGLKSITKLTPEVTIEGNTYVCMTPQLAGISTRELGEAIVTLAERRDEFVAAIDLLVVGF